jgi:hypothetical protein
LKSHLSKVPVDRERMRQPELAHHHEAGAIGKRELLIAVLKK